MNTNNTAILIFARSAQAEASQKKLGKSVALFKELNKQTLRTARATGLPYIISSEKEQQGSSFGERLTNALSKVYAEGYENVVAIGNDTPHLTSEHILSAVKQLENKALVLGPSTDGGFYLMGLRKSHFCSEQFKSLPWQSNALSEEMLSTLSRKRNTVHLLETLSDLDHLGDLKHILQYQTLSQRLLQLVKNLVEFIITITHYASPKRQESFTRLFLNKGSPQSNVTSFY